jgi:tRNA G10  N-methylase Trm11
MSLDLSTCEGGKYHYSYSTLHKIREIAVKICGYKKDIDNFYDEICSDESIRTYGIYDRFWQLLHFSDCEGILIKDFFLEKVDYKLSFYLGSSEKLLKELEDMKEEIKKNPKLIEEKWILKAFNDFYKDIKKEVEDCCGTIRFC